MDFERSEEEVMFGDSVEAFGLLHYPASQRLQQLASGTEPIAARWREMAQLGWLALALPEARSGSGDDDGLVMALMESFGRHLMLEPYVTRCVLGPALLEDAESALARRVLSGIGSGDGLVSLALGEPRAGFALNWIETVAEPSLGGFRLSGTKTQADDGAEAEWFVVPARTSGEADAADGISLFLVHRDAPGLIVQRFRSIDDHRHARLTLNDIQVGADALLAPLGAGLPVLERAVDRAIVSHLAEALGSMDALRVLTLDYLKTRRQFGRPIGAFQVLQHRMVDIDIACEEARSMVYFATSNLRSEPARRRLAAAAAKARVGQCGLFVARQSVQLHGGLGVSSELIVSHHLKRQMMLDLAYGNASHHQAGFAAAGGLAA